MKWLLLFVSLGTALTVGLVAYHFLMYDFRQSVKIQAFDNFQADITDYLKQYGSLEAGQRIDPFKDFVLRRRRPPVPPPESTSLRPGEPPFRFMVLSPEGVVLRDGGPYAMGDKAPAHVLDRARPIVVNGKMAVQVVQIGTPVLTDQDLNYLKVMRNALTTGIIAGSVIAICLGLLLGNRLGAALRMLTKAIKTMRLDETLHQNVEVRSKDEIGELARAFNKMNDELTSTHADLQKSHNKIQVQAQELRELSIRDPLTNLFNRRHFDSQAELLFNQSVRYRHPLTVMIGDLDHFKQINDTISHAVGDEVLRQVARLIQNNTRKSDMVARYGGEEIVVVFPESTIQQTARTCENLRKRIETHSWRKIHPELSITMSMGLCDDLSLENIEKMLDQADGQLYQAKNSGRNCIRPDIKEMI